GSASIMLRSDSTKVSSPHKRDDAEIVFLKDNVAIHPTQFASERISGRLKLFKQGTSLFMTWVPYKGHRSEASLSEKERSLYTIRAVPFTDIRSIQRHSPALGWQYIIVVLSSGLAYPPLYFYTEAYPDLDFWNLDFPCSSFFCGGVGLRTGTENAGDRVVSRRRACGTNKIG
ncbi:hypothetical protein S83_038879, partial [Arachis hypogaea]